MAYTSPRYPTFSLCNVLAQGDHTTQTPALFSWEEAYALGKNLAWEILFKTSGQRLELARTGTLLAFQREGAVKTQSKVLHGHQDGQEPFIMWYI